MLGKTLTQTDLDALGLKPTDDIYGNATEPYCYRYFQSSRLMAILRANEDGTFKVMACVPDEVRV